MFGVKIEGRLGNQLFQYAFALAQRERLQENFYLDCYRYGYVRDYFELPRYFSLKVPGNAARKLRFQLSKGFKPAEVVQDQWMSPAEFLSRHSRRGILYKGFFQSAEYFQPVNRLITAEFTIRQKYRFDIRQLTGNDRETVVVHIRRGDYLHWGSDDLQYNLSLPDSYYHRCLSALDLTGRNLLFLSDDIGYVKEHLNLPGALFSENNTQITDLQLLMQADYLVLSNSTFSWWGAWLNDRAKRILAPKYWLGFKVDREWPNGIVPGSWESVDVL